MKQEQTDAMENEAYAKALNEQVGRSTCKDEHCDDFRDGWKARGIYFAQGVGCCDCGSVIPAVRHTAHGGLCRNSFHAAALEAGKAVDEKCGQGIQFGRFIMGCGRTLDTPRETYRCYDCDVAFHKNCLKQHCTERKHGDK